MKFLASKNFVAHSNSAFFLLTLVYSVFLYTVFVIMVKKVLKLNNSTDMYTHTPKAW